MAIAGNAYFGQHRERYPVQSCPRPGAGQDYSLNHTGFMPLPNFMLEDIAGSLRAICLFPLFVVMPGYAIGWWGDFFEFRRRSAAFRLAASVPLALAVCPIATYLAGRISMAAVAGLYGLLALAFAAALVRSRRTRGTGWGIPRSLWPFAAIVLVWMVVEVFSLVDLQIGRRLYYPVSSIDTSVRASFVHAISTGGIPPQNPFFLPARRYPCDTTISG